MSFVSAVSNGKVSPAGKTVTRGRRRLLLEKCEEQDRVCIYHRLYMQYSLRTCCFTSRISSILPHTRLCYSSSVKCPKPHRTPQSILRGIHKLQTRIERACMHHQVNKHRSWRSSLYRDDRSSHTRRHRPWSVSVLLRLSHRVSLSL